MQIQFFLMVIANVCGFTFGFSCFQISKYRSDGCRKVAILKIPNDFSGLYLLEVNVSIPISVNKQIDPIAEIINLAEINSHPVEDLIYSVEYPECVPEIRVTAAVFNGKSICEESPYFATDKHGASTISVRIRHTSDIQRHRPESEIESRNIRQAFPNNPFFSGNFAQNHRQTVTQYKPVQNEFAENLRNSLQNNPFLNTPRTPQYTRHVTSYKQEYTPTKSNFDQTRYYQNNPFVSKQNPDFLFQPRSSLPKFDDQPIGECGIINNDHLNLINGGELAVKGDFPWTVAIFLRVGSGRKDIYICAGNQISDRHVLTAGHCTNVAKHRLFVVPGIIDLDNVNSENIYDIRNINQHPNFSQRSPSHDMAILTLTKKVTGMPVCLWPNHVGTQKFVGRKGVVLGWGKYNKNINKASDWLKMIELPIVSQETCIFSDQRLRYLVTSDTFCAGDRDMNGPCSGDSGGGFNMDIDGRYYLRGVVSTAISENKTCDLSHYIIFTDVASHLDWIKRIISF